MENVLKYFDFSNFFEDNSNTFSFPISFSQINSKHFLIFEKKESNYLLYVAQYKSKNEIGKIKPEILELLEENYDKGNPSHRILLRRYLEEI